MRPTEILRSSGQLPSLILECLICGLHSPPFIEYNFKIPNARENLTYSIDILLTLVTLLRSYLAWRVFVSGSFWCQEGAERVCQVECNTQGGPIFALKCEMKERPYMFIMGSQIILITVLGFGIRAAEL